MGRLFVTDLEGPVYKCKHCKMDFAVSNDAINKAPVLIGTPVKYGKLYVFPKCFNVEIGTEKLPYDGLFEVFCIRCASLVGLNYEVEKIKYNEGRFYINRIKLEGPSGGSDDDENQGNMEE